MENFEKIRLVGRGAHGTVFLCKQKVDDKLVILKEIPVDQMSVDERQISLNEAKVLKMLDHPNIVAYYENFLEDKTMIIVMEYVQGGTLFDFLHQRNGNLLTEGEVLHYFGQMVYTLQHVHGKSILHRDLKSQNILLNKKKNILKIGDFGISKILTSKSKAYTVVGTPCYISPELCEGKPYNQKSDIWSLGCLLYELMTLKRPFDAHTLPALVMKIMKGNFEPVSDIYSLALKDLLSCMLHLDPSHRPTAAQIMCNPVMIKVIFKLYIEVGCIPYTKRSKESLESSFSKVGVSSTNTPLIDNESSYGMQRKISPEKERKCSNIWYFENKSSNVTILASPPKSFIRSVGLGSDHKIGVTDSGHLVSWNSGTQTLANLGCHLPDEIPALTATILDERIAINIVSVACGNDFTVCLSSKGVVYTFGKASSGCLGLSSEKEVHQPKIVETLFSHHIISIACGPRHVLAISDENEVFTWGYGNYGCLGLEETEFQLFPKVVRIVSKEKPEKIFCGVDTSFIITENLSLLACGSNRHNKLAMDTGEDHPIDETRIFTHVHSHPLSTAKVKSVGAGKSHTVILTDSGEVYTVGSNRFCQLGWGKAGLDYSMPQKVEKLKDLNVSQVACGDFFTLAVTSENYLYCWGRCPRSLMKKKDSALFDVEVPNLFRDKCVGTVSCNSENCIIIGYCR